MSWYYYTDRHEKAERAERELNKRRRAGEVLEPILPSSKRDLATSFWGQAWNKNLLAYSDYESRMPRGRTYFRGGKVLDLKVETGRVTSLVHGSEIYEIEITIQALPETRWRALVKKCQGQVGGLLELLAGQLSTEIMREVCDLKTGLFPSPKEIKLNCTCPDWASLCKHCAATLYAVGTKLDKDPSLLFLLRDVDPNELAKNTATAVAKLTQATRQSSDRHAAVRGLDLSEIFGIELSELEALVDLQSQPQEERRSALRTREEAMSPSQTIRAPRRRKKSISS